MTDPADILNQNAETHRQKDADYGSSWREVGHILHHLTGGEEVVLETVEDFISFGLFTRRLDKIARSFNGEFLTDSLNYESIRDSHSDESTYGAMHSALLAEQEPNMAERWIGTLESVDLEIEVGPEQAAAITDGGPPADQSIAPGSPGMMTEEEYDESLPIDPRYQEKYEELVE